MLVDFMHGRLKPRDPADALHIAAFEGDLKKIRRLISEKKVPVDTEKSTIMGASANQTPLFLAIQEGNLEAVKLLIDLGADVDHANSIRISPLMSAASCGDLDTVKLLLDLGASPNFVRHSDGATPLSFATHTESDEMASEIVKVLIASGADVELPVNDKQSVLMLAARKNLPKVIALLLQAGANPERRCRLKWAESWTALDHAINEGSHAATEILALVTRTPTRATPGCVS
ncbi:ankyrin repeat domain-containing protein [Paracoccus sp. KR1-242]|uniref:ankyrin repeat domain-containing protein n=1 Tax=Paracoccus sp. KR1-242 TaxID=3410028 RepID=UPI003BFE2077